MGHDGPLPGHLDLVSGREVTTAVGAVSGRKGKRQNRASVSVRALAPGGGSCTSESAVSIIGPPSCSECWPGLAWDGTGHLVPPCLAWPPYFSVPLPVR